MTSSAAKGSPKVAREVAEAEFARMCDAHRIDHDTSDLDDEERAEWEAMKKPVVRDIMRGTIIVDENGLATFTPPGSAKGYTFHRATGATYIALETYAKKDMQNMVAAMAEMTHTDRGELSKLELPDFQICLRLGKLFLADR
jgi:hypothetical protein